MPRDFLFTLRVRMPDEPDAALMREIDDDAEPHDSTEDAVKRWLGGGSLDVCERVLNDSLPDGWYAKIDDDRGDPVTS